MNVEMLAAKYGYNTPIFLSQVEFEGISKNNMRQIFARLKEKGEIEHYGRGIYFIPRASMLLSKKQLDTSQVIASKYIQSIDEVYGFYTGLAFANQLGLTTQMPSRKEIVTNEESSNGREVRIGKARVYLCKPRVHIADYNWQELQLLDFLARMESCGIEDNEATMAKLKTHIASNGLNRSIVAKYIESYPGRVAKLLISRGLIDAFN